MMNRKEEIKEKKTLRKIIISIILLSALIFGIIKFLPINITLKGTGTIIKAIPVDASIIIKTSNFNDLISDLQKNSFWKEIVKFNTFTNLKNSIQYFDSIIFLNNTLNNIFRNDAYISFHLIGIDKIKPIFYFTLSKNSNNHVKNVIEKMLEGKGFTSKRDYENFIVYDSHIQNSQKRFSFTFYNGYILISPSSILIENAIRQINSGYNLTKVNGFKRVEETSGKSTQANIYINYQTISKILAVAFNNYYTNIIKTKNNLAEWTELDVTLKNDLLLLNGFTYINDSVNNIENILIGQTPRKFTLHNIFPTASNTFYALLLSNKELFKQKYYDYLKKEDIQKKYDLRLNNYKKIYKTNFEQVIYDILEDEMGEVKCNLNIGEEETETFFIIHTKGKNITRDILYDIIKKWAISENKNINTYRIKYTIDEGASYNIYKFPINTLIEDLFGVFFNFNDAQYFTLIDNYLVFSGNHQSLNKLIYTNVLNKTLGKSLEYNDFTEYVNSRSNLYYYIKIPRSKEIINKYFNPSICNVYNKNYESFKKINTLAYQISGADDMLYNNITINYVIKTYDNPITEWETLLDTSTNFKPVLVENHYTHENEIFVQDLHHNIYLINNSGRIIWKYKIEEEINSDVYQVDYYKNGKLQLLFSTQKSLHLIDRNGNYVERYPINLRANSTAGMSLFDYDNNKNYRIFIPCENKKIYAYTLDGKIITGWKFGSTDHHVKNPIQHFRVNSKDYIVFADKNKVYITDRRGNTRVRLKKQISKSVNNIFYLDNSDVKARLVTSDNTGNVNFIYFDGSLETLKIENISANHFFDFNDIDADGKKDFIFVDNAQLYVFNRNHKKILSFTFINNINSKPIYFHFSSNDRKIGIVNKEKGEIYLINNNGKLYKGFPLIGSSLFTIGFLENNYGRFNLIVDGRNNYLYNYAIN